VNKASIMSNAVSRSVSGLTFTMTGNYYVQGEVLALTSATVVPLGAVTTPHFAVFINHDATNFVKFRNGSGGADFLQLYPGEPFFGPLYGSCVPYVIADTASCVVEYLIFQY
jgi:hypothetical protein